MPEVAFTERDVADLYAYRAIGSTPAEITKKIAGLETDNQKEREKVRDLTEKAKGVPADGAVVLTGDEAAEHEAIKALGIKAADVAKLTGKVTDLEAKDAERTRKDAFTDAVKALKWPEDTVATLLDMNSLNGATVELKTEKVTDKDGKQVDEQVPYVTLAGEGQKPQKFAEFATASPQLKGIRMDGGNGNGTGDTFRGVPDQRGLGGGLPPVSGGVDALIAANQAAAKAGNPVAPAKTT
jgi:hypothetical protein